MGLPSFCLPCSPSHLMNILLNYLTQFCRPLSQYLQACVHWDSWEDSSLFITESSSYCNCNLHCNFHVVCESCAAHPAWTQHKFSALEDCAVGDRSWMLMRVPKWENYFCQAHPYKRERDQRMGNLSAEQQGDMVCLLRDSCLTESKKITTGEMISAKGGLEDSWSEAHCAMMIQRR